MPTVVQTLYFSPSAKDFVAAGEVDIRKLVETAVAQDSTAFTNHPAAAGTTSVTIVPYATTTLQTDVRANQGWAVNASSADGIVSVAAAVRVIAAGTWTFVLYASVPVGGTGTGTLTTSFTVGVYRVASGGARTLLFSATSGTLASSAVAVAAGLLTATSAQPEYVLAAGETIHTGFLSTTAQVAGVAGAVVVGNINWRVGDAPTFVQVPPPGVRTRYPRATSDTLVTATDTIATVTVKRRTLTDSVVVTDTTNRLTTYKRPVVDSVVVSDAFSEAGGSRRSLVDNLSSGGGTTTYIRPIFLFED